MSTSPAVNISISIPGDTPAGALRAIALPLLAAAAALEPTPGQPSAGTPAPYPAREAPPAMDACKAMWQNAQQESGGKLFNIHDYIGQGLVQGAAPGATPRMSQETQDRLEAAIVALGRSEWGQKWLADDYCASMIDRRYCYEFVGYWVTRASANPDDGFTRHFNRPL